GAGQSGRRGWGGGEPSSSVRDGWRRGKPTGWGGTGGQGEPAVTASSKRSGASLTRSGAAMRTSANWSSRSPSPYVFQKVSGFWNTRASRREGTSETYAGRCQRGDPQAPRMA